jgi:hypothetical protein
MTSLLLVLVGKFVVVFMRFPLFMNWHFSLAGFSILSLFFMPNVLTVICLGEFFFPGLVVLES